MIGGIRETASRLALIAILGAIGAVVFAQKPAKAADLGGDCCADLEERVAELEATTARKGNKKVSVQVYGKMNRVVMFWDDGAERNTYTANNSYSSTRIGFRGKAKISSDWSGGYRLEVEDEGQLSKFLNQFDDNVDNGSLRVRHSFIYLDSKKLGQLRLGQSSTAKDDITKDTHVAGEVIDSVHSDFYFNRGFFLRPKGFNNAQGMTFGGPETIDYSDIIRCYSTSSSTFDCSTRRNGIAYWTPKFFGSTEEKGLWGGWMWSEDDIWSLALRYKDDWGKMFRVGAGIGYEDFTDEQFNNGGGGWPFQGFRRDMKELAGSASIMHLPTGLFVFGAFSSSEDDDSGAVGIFTGTQAPDMFAWDAEIGIQREFIPLGDTTFWGGYTVVNDGIGGFTRTPSPVDGAPSIWNGGIGGGSIPGIPFNTQITGAEVTKWWLALDQNIKSAAMSIYFVYQHIEPELDLVDQDLNRVNVEFDDFDVFAVGGRMYF